MVDCGGGTVDLTVHQIEQPQGSLKELYKASGELRIKFLYNCPSSFFQELSEMTKEIIT